MVLVAPLFSDPSGSQVDVAPSPPAAAFKPPPVAEAPPEGEGLPAEPPPAPEKKEAAEPRAFNWFFCSICPDATIVASGWYLAAEYFETGTVKRIPWRRLISLGVFLLLMLFVVRGFCRMVCPIGAALAPFNRMSLFSVKLRKDSCAECMRCVRDCPTGVGPIADPRSPECIYCGTCLKCDRIGMGFRDEDGESGESGESTDSPAARERREPPAGGGQPPSAS
jgi:ferredoxin